MCNGWIKQINMYHSSIFCGEQLFLFFILFLKTKYYYVVPTGLELTV